MMRLNLMDDQGKGNNPSGLDSSDGRGTIARKKSGQGVIEYAGALVIAAAIVAAGMVVVPPGFSALIETIYDTTGSMLLGHLP